MKTHIVAFDVGGTRLKYGIVSEEGEIISSGTKPSRANEGAHALLETVSEIITQTLVSFDGHISGIGMALSGGIDPDKGVVLLPGKFKHLEGFPIVPLLREKFNLPVYADNDGRLAAYAEKFYGAAKDKKWAVVITIGTGIGSGVIINGDILYDPNLQFGTQLGHIIINKSDEKTCLTGNKGTGEALASSTALALQVRDAIQRGLPSSLTDEYFQNPLSIDFKKVTEACKEGDAVCERELDIWIEKLSVVLINAVHCYAPEIIILSGGATLASDLFLEKLKRTVNKQVFRYPTNDPVEIVISQIQEFSGVIGAAAMVFQKIKHTTS